MVFWTRLKISVGRPFTPQKEIFLTDYYHLRGEFSVLALGVGVYFSAAGDLVDYDSPSQPRSVRSPENRQPYLNNLNLKR